MKKFILKHYEVVYLCPHTYKQFAFKVNLFKRKSGENDFFCKRGKFFCAYNCLYHIKKRDIIFSCRPRYDLEKRYNFFVYVSSVYLLTKSK